MKVNSAAPANTDIDKARGIHKGIWKLAAIDPKEMPTIPVATEISVIVLINLFRSSLHIFCFLYQTIVRYNSLILYCSSKRTFVFYGEL